MKKWTLLLAIVGSWMFSEMAFAQDKKIIELPPSQRERIYKLLDERMANEAPAKKAPEPVKLQRKKQECVEARPILSK